MHRSFAKAASFVLIVIVRFLAYLFAGPELHFISDFAANARYSTMGLDIRLITECE